MIAIEILARGTVFAFWALTWRLIQAQRNDSPDQTTIGIVDFLALSFLRLLGIVWSAATGLLTLLFGLQALGCSLLILGLVIGVGSLLALIVFTVFVALTMAIWIIDTPAPNLRPQPSPSTRIEACLQKVRRRNEPKRKRKNLRKRT